MRARVLASPANWIASLLTLGLHLCPGCLAVPNSSEDLRGRVRQILEEQVARIDSPQSAAEILRHAQRLGAGLSEQRKAKETVGNPGSVIVALERAADLALQSERTGAMLAETAAYAASPRPDASAVLYAARDVLGATHGVKSPAVERGRRLLREAALREMGPLEALDARAFLAINRLPHPPWSARSDRVFGLLLIGGGVWALGVLGAALCRVPRSRRALRELLPSVIAATLIVEYPIKGFLRRQRGFDHLVRGLALGKKPSGRSLPSGHTASSFACASVLSATWARQGILFWALAIGAGFTRIYAGVHYPSEVLWGALLGVLVAEPIRRLAKRVSADQVKKRRRRSRLRGLVESALGR